MPTAHRLPGAEFGSSGPSDSFKFIRWFVRLRAETRWRSGAEAAW